MGTTREIVVVGAFDVHSNFSAKHHNIREKKILPEIVAEYNSNWNLYSTTQVLVVGAFDT